MGKKIFYSSKNFMSGVVHIVPPLSVMDHTNPWKDDVLKRKKIATVLTSVVAGEKEPFVVMLNGAWGTGKTFFLQRWWQELGNNGWHTLYFNAWQDDFLDEPLVALIGQLQKRLSTMLPRKIGWLRSTIIKDWWLKHILGWLTNWKTSCKEVSDLRLFCWKN